MPPNIQCAMDKPKEGNLTKNIQKELGDMGYKAFKVSTQVVKLLVYFHLYHMPGVHYDLE